MLPLQKICPHPAHAGYYAAHQFQPGLCRCSPRSCRAVQFPRELPGAPPPPPPCAWEWRRARCSAGCTLRLPKGRTPVAASPAAPAAPAVDVSKADSSRKRSVASCPRRPTSSRRPRGGGRRLDRKGGRGAPVALLQLKAADAFTCAMRIETKGNIMVLGHHRHAGGQEFWGRWPRAHSLAKAASKDPVPRGRGWRTPRWTRSCTRPLQGIAQQAPTGAGNEFKRLAEHLSRATAWDSAGRCYEAGFCYIAPWPLGDKKRAPGWHELPT